MRLSIALLLLARFALAQQQPPENPPINTDRPDITESAVVVPRGSLQVESGVTWTLDHAMRSVDLSESLVRFGVAKRTELRFGVPNYLDALTPGRPLNSGFADVSFGFKQQLGPLPGEVDVSVIVAVSMPTGAQGVTSDGFDPFLKVPWSKELKHGWSVGGQQSLFWNSDAGHHVRLWEPTLYLEQEFTPAWDAFAEYGGDYPQQGHNRQVAHFGTAYKIRRTQQVDFHFGYGLNHATPNHFFAVGYSVRLDHVLRAH